MYSMPSIKLYMSSNKKIDNIIEDKLMKATIKWATTTFKHSVTSTRDDTLYENIEMCAYHKNNEWKSMLDNVFTVMNMPPKYSGQIYDALSYLDSTLYNIMYPFPSHLEFPKQTIIENTMKASAPLTNEQKEYLLKANGFLFPSI